MAQSFLGWVSRECPPKPGQRDWLEPVAHFDCALHPHPGHCRRQRRRADWTVVFGAAAAVVAVWFVAIRPSRSICLSPAVDICPGSLCRLAFGRHWLCAVVAGAADAARVGGALSRFSLDHFGFIPLRSSSVFSCSVFSICCWPSSCCLAWWGRWAIGCAKIRWLMGWAAKPAQIPGPHPGVCLLASTEMSATLPPDAVVQFLWEPRTYYCQLDCRGDHILDKYSHLEYLAGDADHIARALQMKA